MNVEDEIKYFLIKLGETVNNTRYDDDTILFYLNNGRRKVASDTKFYAVVESLTVQNDGEYEFPLKSSFIDIWKANEAVTVNDLPRNKKTLSDKFSIKQLESVPYLYYLSNNIEGTGYYFKEGQVIYLLPTLKQGDVLKIRGYAYPDNLTKTTGIDTPFTDEFGELAILAAVIEAKSDSGKDFSLDRNNYIERSKKLRKIREADGPRYESLPIR